MPDVKRTYYGVSKSPISSSRATTCASTFRAASPRSGWLPSQSFSRALATPRRAAAGSPPLGAANLRDEFRNPRAEGAPEVG